MYLGQEVCVREFVPQLPTLASDTMFHVRKVGQYNSVYSWIFLFVCFFSCSRLLFVVRICVL